ncbi:unnamed protein product [Protopolystoma xenopodis]|uniref:Uncharacterized protein n=1 Tax=Protopolystoma xenopodis TaxID=117903 RepID=A0A448XM47_9PLAT|nr:unnamed protein product [Protopolystoma xenopodis]
MAILTDDADYRSAKRLGMYHVHGPTLEMMMHTMDSGLGTFLYCPGSKRLLFGVFIESPSLLKQYTKLSRTSLFQSPVHQVSLEEDVYSLPDLPFPGVFPIYGQSFRCIPGNCMGGNGCVFSYLRSVELTSISSESVR